MNNHIITTDIIFIHAPAFFDFRKMDTIYFPYLSTSSDVPITPLYEYFPLGFKSLQKALQENDINVKLLNLATFLLKYPHIEIETIINNIHAKIYAIDLHWMVHVQGALKIASVIKKNYSESYILLGGISSTYYAHELINYPFIDMVMRGYDTHQPMIDMLINIKNNSQLYNIPNLLWKDTNNTIIDNGFTYKPSNLSYGINWADIPNSASTDILSLYSAGCNNNCGWCGGSKDAFRRINDSNNNLVFKESNEITYEFNSIHKIRNIDKSNYYICGSYNENKAGMEFLLNKVKELKIKSVDYEQFLLTPDAILEMMVKAHNKTIITLSPESHDIKIARLAGRGAYTMSEMENWIKHALKAGIYEIDIWFFIGLPQQDKKSVFETVTYCERLLKMFKGEKVIPLICPMIPFLDPASNFFTNPQKHGYKIYYNSVEDHKNGALNSSIINRINYQTQWLSREELVFIGFEAIKRLFMIKGEAQVLPSNVVHSVIDKINDAIEFIKIVHEIDCIANESIKIKELYRIKSEIKKRNDEIFFNGVSNQTFPINRKIGGRWFDELLWNEEIIKKTSLI